MGSLVPDKVPIGLSCTDYDSLNLYLITNDNIFDCVLFPAAVKRLEEHHSMLPINESAL